MCGLLASTGSAKIEQSLTTSAAINTRGCLPLRTTVWIAFTRRQGHCAARALTSSISVRAGMQSKKKACLGSWHAVPGWQKRAWNTTRGFAPYCLMRILQIRLEVLTAVTMKMAVFWVVAPRRLVWVYQPLKRRYTRTSLHGGQPRRREFYSFKSRMQR
jgi:hypothetical protein